MSKDGKGEKYERDVKDALKKIPGMKPNKKVDETHANTPDGGVDWKGSHDKGTVRDAIKKHIKKQKKDDSE
jgi:hypothetical protein